MSPKRRRSLSVGGQNDQRWGVSQEAEITRLIARRLWIRASHEWVCMMDEAEWAPAQEVATVSVNVARAWLQAGVWYEAESILRVLNPESHHTEEIAHLKQLIQAERDGAEKDLRIFFEGQAGTTLPSVWKILTEASPHLSPPSIRQGEDGYILDWSNPGVGLEIEIDGGTLQWGAHDHAYNHSVWGDCPIDSLCPDLVLWLQRVCISHFK